MKTNPIDNFETSLLRAETLLKDMKTTLLDLLQDNKTPVQTAAAAPESSSSERKKSSGNVLVK
jgi:hypothetical protein